MRRDQCQNNIFGVHPRLQLTGDLNSHAFRFCLPNRLCRKDMLHFTRTDPKCDRAESTMGGSMGITANDRFSWLGQAYFWANHMDNSLVGRAIVTQFDPKIMTVFT